MEAVCTRAIIIAHGRVVADATPRRAAAAAIPSARLDEVFRELTRDPEPVIEPPAKEAA